MACSSVTSSLTNRLTSRLVGGLETAVLNQNDPETVRQGAPAFLLMLDGFLAEDPDNADLLLSAARLYSSYAAAFVDDPERARVLSKRARDYGWAGLCHHNRQTCGMWGKPYDEFEAIVDGLGSDDIEATFVAASAWATWIQANREDWSAIADKARVEKMMLQVVVHDEAYQRGAAHLYLGVLATLLPEAMGGKPEEGRRHFERAAQLSGDRDLMPKVLLASEYARLVFDRQLHDTLCREVLEADPVEPGLTLSNILAQNEAERLLADSLDYFGE